jgi:hypothetical protein
MQTRHLPSVEEPPAAIRPPPQDSRRQPSWNPARALIHHRIPLATDCLYAAQAPVGYDAKAEEGIALL